MQIWPAIDLRGGRCVRLEQGDYQRETVFSDDPVDTARAWVERGADRLHLVDLDGARDGRAANREAVEAILGAVNVPCQLGGGIRDEPLIQRWLESGMSRLVIGTQALKDTGWFQSMCRRFPERIVLGLDARNGLVATDGWLETSSVKATEFAARYQDEPIAAVVYTDIARDGMMAGPNFTAIAELRQAVTIPVIASGGITTAADITRLAEIGVAGGIVGRTLYEGKLTIAEACEAARLAK